MTAREFLNGKNIKFDKNVELFYENLLEEFAHEYLTKTDLRHILLHHPNQDEVQTACLHFLGDDAQKWWNDRQIELNQNC